MIPEDITAKQALSLAFKLIRKLDEYQLLYLKAATNSELSRRYPQPISRIDEYWNSIYTSEELDHANQS